VTDGHAGALLLIEIGKSLQVTDIVSMDFLNLISALHRRLGINIPEN